MPAAQGDPDLFARFEELGRLGRLTLDRLATGEWEVRVVNFNHENHSDFIVTGDRMLDVVARTISHAELLGWIRAGSRSK